MRIIIEIETTAYDAHGFSYALIEDDIRDCMENHFSAREVKKVTVERNEAGNQTQTAPR